MKDKRIKSEVSEANNGLNLLYQPIMEPAKNLLVGYECLLRIYDMELGVLTPDMFMEVAQKDVKLIKRLEDWSIEEVLKTSKKLAGRALSILAVNISTKHFQDGDFVETTARLIEKSGVKPNNVYFELKEDALLVPCAEITAKIAALKDLGIKIAIDGFVAPQENGPPKCEFGLDMVKLPLRAVKDFITNKDSRIIIKAIIAYAKQRDIEVVALGVETKEQEEALLKLGVRKMQGYLYSKPLIKI
jgi:EAL domain-containing protein (putative c-di-GMP-specific phosphodiesterase class I)